MRRVSQWLAIYKFSLVYCVTGSSVTAVFCWWVQPCHQKIIWSHSFALPFAHVHTGILGSTWHGQGLRSWVAPLGITVTGGCQEGERSLSSTCASRWQAASCCFPILVRMLGKRVLVFARMLGMRCSCTLVAAWALCSSHSLLYPSLPGGFCSCATPGGSWLSSLLCKQFYWCGFHL